jgi:hypothetical protein
LNKLEKKVTPAAIKTTNLKEVEMAEKVPLRFPPGANIDPAPVFGKDWWELVNDKQRIELVARDMDIQIKFMEEKVQLAKQARDMVIEGIK